MGPTTTHHYCGSETGRKSTTSDLQGMSDRDRPWAGKGGERGFRRSVPARTRFLIPRPRSGGAAGPATPAGDRTECGVRNDGPRGDELGG